MHWLAHLVLMRFPPSLTVRLLPQHACTDRLARGSCCVATKALGAVGLVVLTWGYVSWVRMWVGAGPHPRGLHQQHNIPGDAGRGGVAQEGAEEQAG